MSYLSICKHITLFQYHFLYLCSGGIDFDIMNKIVADGVDRHLVNVEERRIMIDKNIMKSGKVRWDEALTVVIFIGINDFVRKIEKFFRSPIGQT